MMNEVTSQEKHLQLPDQDKEFINKFMHWCLGYYYEDLNARGHSNSHTLRDTSA